MTVGQLSSELLTLFKPGEPAKMAISSALVRQIRDMDDKVIEVEIEGVSTYGGGLIVLALKTVEK